MLPMLYRLLCELSSPREPQKSYTHECEEIVEYQNTKDIKDQVLW